MEEKIAGLRLVLHLDVNKTLIMADPASQKAMPDVLNDIISEIFYGKIDEESNDWVPVTDKPMPSEPPPNGADGQPLINYYDYLNKVIPGDDHRNERTRRKAKFTEPGQPGYIYRHYYEKLEACLRFPQTTTPSTATDIDTNTDTETASHTHKNSSSEKFHYLVPSFLNLLKHLHDTRRQFTLVFRTYGQDLPELVTHFDEFCEGKHPLYPDVALDGRDGGIDYRISNRWDKIGTFYRCGKTSDDTFLIMGTLELIPNTPHIENWNQSKAKGMEFYQEKEFLEKHAHNFSSNKFAAGSGSGGSGGGDPPVLRTLRGFREIYHFFNAEDAVGTFACRDYYPWWRANDDAGWAGKLLAIDPNEESVLHLFFDDNLYFLNQPHHMAIIDLRTLEGEMLPLREYLFKHVVKVEPYDVITDPQYFIKCLATCEQNFTKQQQFS
jgi:hypothetical protein